MPHLSYRLNICDLNSWLHIYLFFPLQLHGTFRNKYRVYSEDIFYGKGKALDDVTEEERQRDLAERKSENPLAYRGNVNLNELVDTDIDIIQRNDYVKW